MSPKKKRRDPYAFLIRTLGAILALVLLSACTSTGELDLSPGRILSDLRCVSALATAGLQVKNETRSPWEILAGIDKATAPADVLAACAGLLENLEKTSQGIKARQKPEQAPEAPVVPNPAPRSSLGITLVSSGSWQAPALPWKTFSGDMANAASGHQLVGCPAGGEVYVAVFKDGSKAYVMFYASGTGRIVFLYDPAPDNPSADPVAVGYGQVDKVKNDEVPPLKWEPYSSQKAQDVCEYLYPKGVSI